jgi:hypothetical protein
MRRQDMKILEEIDRLVEAAANLVRCILRLFYAENDEEETN